MLTKTYNNKRILRLSSLIFCSFLLNLSFASTPRAVINAARDLPLEKQEDVMLAEASLTQATLGLTPSLSVTPKLSYGDTAELVDICEPNPNNADGCERDQDNKIIIIGEEYQFGTPSFDVGVAATASLDYEYDQPDILNQRIALLKAQRNLINEQRSNVENALLDHAEMLRARTAWLKTQRDIESRQANLETLQNQDDATEAQIASARLSLQTSQTNLAKAQRRFDQATSEMNMLGFSAPFSLELLTFNLPNIMAEETREYEELRLNIERTEIVALQNSAFGIFQEAKLSSEYLFEPFGFSGNVGVKSGKPNAGVSAQYGTDKHEWNIALSVNFKLDNTIESDFATGERNVVDAQQTLEDFVTDYETDADDLLFDIDIALDDIAVATERLEVNNQRIAEIEAQIPSIEDEIASMRTQLEQVNTQRDAAEGEQRTNLTQQVRDLEAEIRTLERSLPVLEREFERTQNGLLDNEDLIVRAWTSYVQKVADYLAVVEADWVIQ